MYETAETANGWIVTKDGETVAGPYGYRSIAVQEMNRLIREGK